jgi:two-component system sensor histidine kinase TctE
LQEALDKRSANDLAAIPVETTTRDVQRMGGAVNGLMARVEAGVRAQREFAGNVAHELRTPLAGIRAMAEYGLAHQVPEVWRQQLTSIAASETRASHMVEQLLALAFADESRDTLRLQPVQMDELVRRVVLEAMWRADALGVDLGVAGADEPVQVMGDSALIEGALNNLIDNALRHGKPPDGSPAVVTVKLDTHTDGVTLLVSDNGPGIGPEARQLLLQRWQQAAMPSHQDGLKRHGVGLGLAIVFRYAALLGARFELGDNPSQDAIPVSGLCAALQWPPDNAFRLESLPSAIFSTA